MIQLIFAGYILLVIFLSLIPTAAIGAGMHSDKLAHFLAYGGMGFLAYISVQSRHKKVYLFIFIISLGVVLELFQLYIPGRSASFFDIVANTLGATMGYLVVWIVISGILNNSALKEELSSNNADADHSHNLEKVP
ncbi:MAG: VanZ family protein [Thermodesulfobacteriota bacterium]